MRMKPRKPPRTSVTELTDARVGLDTAVSRGASRIERDLDLA